MQIPIYLCLLVASIEFVIESIAKYVALTCQSSKTLEFVSCLQRISTNLRSSCGSGSASGMLVHSAPTVICYFVLRQEICALSSIARVSDSVV